MLFRSALPSFLASLCQIIKLLIHRIAISFRENGMKVPRDLHKAVDPGFNKIIDNLRSSKLVIDSSNFAAWRKKRENPDFGGSSQQATVEQEPALRKRRSVDYAGQDSSEDGSSSSDDRSDGEGEGPAEAGNGPEQAVVLE